MNGTSNGTGGADPSGTNTSPNHEAIFTCDPAQTPPVATLRRLTMAQYRNTLAGLAYWALGDLALGTQLMGDLASSLATLPDDQREPEPQDLHGSYRRLDQTLQQEHVDAFYAIGVAAGTYLTTPARFAKVVGACATDADSSNDGACLDTFIQHFGTKVLRRPLTPDEITFYESVYGTSTASDPLAYADIIGVMLNSPQFLYFIEHGDDQVAGTTNVYDVSPYELASRLSYQFWETMPDDELLQTAADGSLAEDSTYQREVDRLYADPQTRATMAGFVQDWLKLDDLPALDAHNQDPTFLTFAAANLPSAELRRQMMDDISGMADYFIWTKPGSLSELLTTNASFNKGPELAKIYGVDPWDGVSPPAGFAPGQRPGLLTRALFLTSGSTNTRPILKGVFIRRNMICDDLPPPPPGANAVPPELRPDMTTRQVVEGLTEVPGTVCGGCHKSLINPLGFATEQFDALGRFRSAQRLFDANGVEVGSKPVDTHSIPAITAGDMTPSEGPADLMRLIVESGKADACLARNYFRFTYARWEDLTIDGCTLESLRQRLSSGGNLGDLLKQVAMTPAFKQRTFQ